MGNNFDLGSRFNTGLTALTNPGNVNALTQSGNQVLPGLVDRCSEILGAPRGSSGTGRTGRNAAGDFFGDLSKGLNDLSANAIEFAGDNGPALGTAAGSIVGSVVGSAVKSALTTMGVPPGSLGNVIGGGVTLLSYGASIAQAATPLVTGLIGRLGRMLG